MIEVREAKKEDKEGWNRLVNESDDGWLFHLFEWKKAGEAFYAGKYKPRYVVAEENGKMVGVLPLLEDVNFSKQFYSMLGGPCVRKDAANKDMIREKMLSWIDREAKVDGIVNTHMELPSLAPLYLPPNQHNIHWLKSYGYKDEPRSVDYTYILNLKNPLENIWNGIDKRRRTNIRKAVKNEIIITKGYEKSDIKEYYNKLHLDTYKRTGATPLPIDYFYKLLEVFSPKKMFHLFFAEYQGERIAGAMLLTYKNAGRFNSNASLQKYWEFRANELLIWHMINFLKNNGYEWYEIGGVLPSSSTPKLQGILGFKEKWGAQLIKSFDGVKYHSKVMDLIHRNEMLRQYSSKISRLINESDNKQLKYLSEKIKKVIL